MKKLYIILKEKWAEYILEIVVITFGIMGAFVLNHWNEQRKNRILEHNYLLQIRENLISDSISLQNVRAQIDTHLSAAGSLLDFIDNGFIADTLALKKSIMQGGYLFFSMPICPRMMTW